MKRCSSASYQIEKFRVFINVAKSQITSLAWNSVNTSTLEIKRLHHVLTTLFLTATRTWKEREWIRPETLFRRMSVSGRLRVSRNCIFIGSVYSRYFRTSNFNNNLTLKLTVCIICNLNVCKCILPWYKYAFSYKTFLESICDLYLFYYSVSYYLVEFEDRCQTFGHNIYADISNLIFCSEI